MNHEKHFSGCSTATAHFPYSKSLKEGHMVYFQAGGHMTIIVMKEDGNELSDKGRSNAIRTIKNIIESKL